MNRCILLSLLLQKVAWLKFRVGKDQYGLEYLGEAIEREETGLNPKEKLCTGRWLPRYLLCPLVPGRNSPFETPGLWLNQVADSPWSGGKHSANGRRPEMSCCCQSSLACQFLMPHLQCKDAESYVTILTNHILKNPLVLSFLECFPDQDIS